MSKGWWNTEPRISDTEYGELTRQLFPEWVLRHFRKLVSIREETDLVQEVAGLVYEAALVGEYSSTSQSSNQIPGTLVYRIAVILEVKISLDWSGCIEVTSDLPRDLVIGSSDTYRFPTGKTVAIADLRRLVSINFWAFNHMMPLDSRIGLLCRRWWVRFMREYRKIPDTTEIFR